MNTSARKIKIYISHALAMKKRYEKANLKGQHNEKIKNIEADIIAAKQKLKSV